MPIWRLYQEQVYENFELNLELWKFANIARCIKFRILSSGVTLLQEVLETARKQRYLEKKYHCACTGNIQTINLPLPVWSTPTTQGDVLTKDQADKKSKRCSSLTPQLPSNELVHHQVPETPRDTDAPVQESQRERAKMDMLVFKSTLGCVRCTFCPGYSNISVSTIYRCGKCQCFAICDVSVGTK